MAREAHRDDLAGGRHEVLLGVFGAQTGLDGMAAQPHVGLRQRHALASGHTQHQLDDVDAGHLLRHRMLDLQPRIDLQEPVPVARDQELHRADAAVAQSLRQAHGVGQHLLAQPGRQRRGGGFLDQLLVAPLQRAFALEQVDDAALTVPGDLHLDVPATLDVGLDDQRGVAEGAAGLAHRGGDGLGQRSGLAHHMHALAAAAGRRLEQHRQRQGARPGGHHLGIGTGLLTASQHRHAGSTRLGLGRCLVAQPFDDLGRGADEHQPGRLDGAREIRVLGKEAVAGVDGLRTAALGRGDDRIDAQVALGRAATAQADRFADHGRVQCIAVGAGMHAGRGDAQALAGAGDAAGDLAAVGDQDFLEHLSFPRRRTPPTAHESGRAKRTPRNRLRRAAGVAPLRGARSA